jgi:predicted Zn-dependent protease
MNSEILLIIGLVIAAVLFVIVSRRKESIDNKENVDPLAEAEEYIAYGRNKKAIKIIEKYLSSYPDDAKAMELLNKARGGM